jgi:DNA processing protein
VRDSAAFWLGLNTIENLRLAEIREILREEDGEKRLLELSEQELLRRFAPKEGKRKSGWLRQTGERELANATKRGFSVLTPAEMPPLLLEIHDPPIALYVRGAMAEVDSRSVAVVGSRAATEYGREMAETIGGDIATRGITVVSGMARGIDSCAHEGALSAGGRTIAVLGSGLDVIYPTEGRGLYEKISKAGAVISEFPLGTEPRGMNFPQRNRIISGLSRGVVVVEAAKRSGSLITAQYGVEQGRDVFAVPGPAGSEMSEGTHDLIRQGARLVSSGAEVCEELFPEVPAKAGSRERPAGAPGLSGDDLAIYRKVEKTPRHIDEITREAGLPPATVSAVLMSLEIRGLVRQRTGKLYVKAEAGRSKRSEGRSR